MPEHRQRKLPFKNLRPGRKFAQSFEARHKRRIRFGKSSPQEGKQFRCTNAENLTSYFATLEDLINTNSIDPSRIANLDESGISQGKEKLGSSKHKH